MKLVQRALYTAALMAAVVSGSSKIDKDLQQHFLQGNENAEPQSVIVSFTHGIGGVLARVNQLRFASIATKRRVLRESQIKFCNGAQRQVQNFLSFAGVKFETFWINNKMHIPKADNRLLQQLANFSSVASIEKEKVAHVSLPVNENAAVEVMVFPGNVSSGTQKSRNTWGVRKIRAPRVWRNYTGLGVVVANIDTGVRHTHEALRNNWRSQYGWYDPFYGTASPNDENGHGTHTMGTIAGGKGIGVAPNATWISCKGCSPEGACPDSALMQCGQWIMCPTLPNRESRNCSMAPDIVSNSWGGIRMGSENWYDDIISSWHAAGITPVFAIGNSGPDCETAMIPGARPNVIGVGNTDIRDRIHWSSSRGPRSDTIKPDVTAPGTNVRSAFYLDDTSYATWTGTSMSAPHVAGVIALMLQKTPGLTYPQIYQAITTKAKRRGLNSSGAETCGGREPNQFPNNVFGFGRIDALNAVRAV